MLSLFTFPPLSMPIPFSLEETKCRRPYHQRHRPRALSFPRARTRCTRPCHQPLQPHASPSARGGTKCKPPCRRHRPHHVWISPRKATKYIPPCHQRPQLHVGPGLPQVSLTPKHSQISALTFATVKRKSVADRGQCKKSLQIKIGPHIAWVERLVLDWKVLRRISASTRSQRDDWEYTAVTNGERDIWNGESRLTRL